MKILLKLLIIAIGLGFPTIANAVEFKFADAEKAREILLAQDAYYNRMSPAEIAIRARSTTPDKTTADLKAQYGAAVLDWPADVQAQFAEVIAASMPALERAGHLLPDVIYLIRTTDDVEGGLPHTHANAIIVQDSFGPLSPNLLFHETFHVLSRAQLARHIGLYGLLGFQGCTLDETEQIRAMHLTNPDVPMLGYYLPANFGEEQGAIMPFLYASRPAFDPEIERGFGGHFGFGLLRIEVADGVCTVVPGADGLAQLLSPGDVPEFFAAIGQNTGYIIHAEEVLADNFVFLLTGKADLPNPEIVERLGQWIDE